MSMTVEQALKDAEWLATAAYDSGVRELGYDPIAILRSHIEREVDEAMVHRALAAQWEYEQKHASPEGTVYANGSMKAALIAALGEK